MAKTEEAKKPATSEEIDISDLEQVRAAMDDPDFIWVL